MNLGGFDMVFFEKFFVSGHVLGGLVEKKESFFLTGSLPFLFRSGFEFLVVVLNVAFVVPIREAYVFLGVGVGKKIGFWMEKRVEHSLGKHDFF